MKTSVSNIAWSPDDDETVIARLCEEGVDGVEVAPTALWGPWDDIDLRRVSDYRGRLSGLGLSVPAMQAIFFGRQFSLFDPNALAPMTEHLKRVSEIGAALGARALVFGSPALRARRALGMTEALGRATEAFQAFGDAVGENGCVIGLEANPIEYGCDFLTNTADVVSFVTELKHPSVCAHIDTGALIMTDDHLQDAYLQTDIAHFHISAPQLAPIKEQGWDYAGAIAKLRAEKYQRWISLEMKRPESLDILFENIAFFAALNCEKGLA